MGRWVSRSPGRNRQQILGLGRPFPIELLGARSVLARTRLHGRSLTPARDCRRAAAGSAWICSWSVDCFGIFFPEIRKNVFKHVFLSFSQRLVTKVFKDVLQIVKPGAR